MPSAYCIINKEDILFAYLTHYRLRVLVSLYIYIPGLYCLEHTMSHWILAPQRTCCIKLIIVKQCKMLMFYKTKLDPP